MRFKAQEHAFGASEVDEEHEHELQELEQEHVAFPSFSFATAALEQAEDILVGGFKFVQMV